MVIQYQGQVNQILLKAEIYTVDYNVCNKLYNGFLEKNVLCAGTMTGVRDACQVNINF